MEQKDRNQNDFDILENSFYVSIFTMFLLLFSQSFINLMIADVSING